MPDCHAKNNFACVLYSLKINVIFTTEKFTWKYKKHFVSLKEQYPSRGQDSCACTKTREFTRDTKERKVEFYLETGASPPRSEMQTHQR